MPTYKVKQYGPRGLAHVKVAKDKVTVAYETGETFAILPEDAPKEITSGDFIVTLNTDRNKIFNVSPPKGSYICKFKGFLKDKDGKYVIKDKPFNNSGKWPVDQHLEFYPVFVVTGKKCTGLEILYSLWWVFKEHESGQVTITGKRMNKVAEFMERCGLDFEEDDTPYKENPQDLLKMYETLLLGKNIELAVTLNASESGFVYVDTLGEIPQ